jgi:hypothetical protein
MNTSIFHVLNLGFVEDTARLNTILGGKNQFSMKSLGLLQNYQNLFTKYGAKINALLLPYNFINVNGGSIIRNFLI